MERGHSEEDAQRLWDVLDRAVGIEGAGEPGANRSLTDAAKAFVNELTRGAIGSNEAGGQDAQTAKDAAGGRKPRTTAAKMPPLTT